MRILKVTPVFAILALAACGDQQTSETEQSSPPPVADAPAQEAPSDAPAEMTTQGPAGMTEDLSSNTDAPPAPSAVFEEGVDALGEIDDSERSFFTDAPFDAGEFRAEGYRLVITAEGGFTLHIEARDQSLDGDLRVYGDMFTMSNITQETDPGAFPMTCRVTSAPEGFSLAADGPSCAMFDGLTFARVE